MTRFLLAICSLALLLVSACQSDGQTELVRPPLEPITSGVGALLLAQGVMQARHPSGGEGPGSQAEFFLIYGGISLAVGLPLLSYGWLAPRDVYVRDSVTLVSLNLMLARKSIGPQLRVLF